MKRLRELLGTEKCPVLEVLGVGSEAPIQHLPAWLKGGMAIGKEWLDGTGQTEEVRDTVGIRAGAP